MKKKWKKKGDDQSNKEELNLHKKLFSVNFFKTSEKRGQNVIKEEASRRMSFEEFCRIFFGNTYKTNLADSSIEKIKKNIYEICMEIFKGSF